MSVALLLFEGVSKSIAKCAGGAPNGFANEDVSWIRSVLVSGSRTVHIACSLPSALKHFCTVTRQLFPALGTVRHVEPAVIPPPPKKLLSPLDPWTNLALSVAGDAGTKTRDIVAAPLRPAL